MAEDIWQQEKIRHAMVYGAWFYETHGIPEIKKGGVPVKGWSLIEIIPGKFKSPLDLRKKVDAILELHPNCDILLLGQGTDFLIFDLREYKETYWPKIKLPGEHIT